MAPDSMEEIFEQQRLQGKILVLAKQIVSEHNGFLFHLPTVCSGNILQSSSVTGLMKIHLASPERIALNTIQSSGQAHKKHIQHSAQDHGCDTQLSWPDERKRQCDQDYDNQNQRKQSQRKHVAADCEFRQTSFKSARQIEQQPVILANQCLDFLVEWF